MGNSNTESYIVYDQTAIALSIAMPKASITDCTWKDLMTLIVWKNHFLKKWKLQSNTNIKGPIDALIRLIT